MWPNMSPKLGDSFDKVWLDGACNLCKNAMDAATALAAAMESTLGCDWAGLLFQCLMWQLLLVNIHCFCGTILLWRIFCGSTIVRLIRVLFLAILGTGHDMGSVGSPYGDIHGCSI